MILLTGSTGFIGGQVLRELSKKKVQVRCLVRKNITSENSNISYVVGDVLDYDSLVNATAGVDTVYYLIHMMGKQKEQEKFDKLDRIAITNMIRACKTNGVNRIIHLTGMSSPHEKLSTHLESRKEVEEIIKNSGINYTIFRASIIIGKGGAAFEIFDTVVRKLSIIPVFDWGQTKVQAIYTGDVIKYLIECLDKKETFNRYFDIGSSDVFTYKELMQQYSDALGLKRFFVRIPGSYNWISSTVLGKLAPVDPDMVYWLIESLKNNMIVQPNNLKEIFGFEPVSFKESVRRILEADQ
jgi:uncharacterized protein YbjT (DUF2867 family)